MSEQHASADAHGAQTKHARVCFTGRQKLDGLCVVAAAPATLCALVAGGKHVGRGVGSRHGDRRSTTACLVRVLYFFCILLSIVFARHMVNDTTNAHAQIQDAIDWLAAAQFNFINSENGFSEFTHGSCQLMLDWMNFATTYAKTTYNIPMFIKAHCSTGQTCPDLHDPRTNQPVQVFFFLKKIKKLFVFLFAVISTFCQCWPTKTWAFCRILCKCIALTIQHRCMAIKTLRKRFPSPILCQDFFFLL